MYCYFCTTLYATKCEIAAFNITTQPDNDRGGIHLDFELIVLLANDDNYQITPATGGWSLVMEMHLLVWPAWIRIRLGNPRFSRWVNSVDWQITNRMLQLRTWEANGGNPNQKDYFCFDAPATKNPPSVPMVNYCFLTFPTAKAICTRISRPTPVDALLINHFCWTQSLVIPKSLRSILEEDVTTSSTAKRLTGERQFSARRKYVFWKIAEENSPRQPFHNEKLVARTHTAGRVVAIVAENNAVGTRIRC